MHPGAPFIAPADIELLQLATGRITTPLHRADIALAPPVWSPDSRALAVCDGLHGPPSIRVYHLPTGRVTTPARDACFPAYVGPRLAFRDLNSVTHLGDRLVADSGTLSDLLHRGVYQEPAPVGAGGVLAVSATTVTPAGGPPPITTVVLLDGSGKVVARWDTGVIADTVSLLADGHVIAASRPAGDVLEDVDTGEVLEAPRTTHRGGREHAGRSAHGRALRRPPDRVRDDVRAGALGAARPHVLPAVDALGERQATRRGRTVSSGV